MEFRKSGIVHHISANCAILRYGVCMNRRKDGPAAFDALGNVTNDGVGHTYVWDAENRLSSANGYAYVYDAFGRRVKGLSGEVLYDLSGHAVAWLDAGTGGWNIGELYADARHVATYSGGTTNFLHTDWLGTRRIMTSVTGATSETCTALSFGDGNNCAGTDWTYNNFTDDPHDNESNTEHTWFRQLSTTEGRWLSPDPAGLAAVDPTNPQSWNRYAYVGNDPMSFVDPLGLFMQCGAGSHAAPDPSDPRASICVDGTGVNASTTHQIPHPVTTADWDDIYGTGPPILRRQVPANNGPKIVNPNTAKLVGPGRKITTGEFFRFWGAQISCEAAVGVAQVGDHPELYLAFIFGLAKGYTGNVFAAVGGLVTAGVTVLGDALTARETCVPAIWGPGHR
jgi:RHS repeat-associated protein